MSSLHRRSSSVCREPSLSSYRPTFSTRTETTSRFSRASSCDPSSRTSFRPLRPSMSTSYHSDYSSRSTPLSYSSRYASTGNLSASVRSPYTSSTYRLSDSSPTPPSYRASDSYRTPSTYRASSSFTPRFESRLPPRDFSSSGLSKYRPESSSYSRPTYSGSQSSSSYLPRPRTEFRSKTPAASEPTMKHGRFDRDYKSMTRFEKTPVSEDKSEDEVENTFQRLYDRYVKVVDLEEKATKRKFVSHSEAEETNSEEDDSLGEPSLAESLRKDEASMTPKGPSPSLVTPIASPVAKKKVIEEPKEAEKKAQTAEEFIQKHCDVEMKPAVIEARVLQPAASAMANLLKMTNFTTKISDALLKKKTEPETRPAVSENFKTATPVPTKKPAAAESALVPGVAERKSTGAPKGGFFKASSPKPVASPPPNKTFPTSTGPEAVVTPAPPAADPVSPPPVKEISSLSVPMVSGSGKIVQRATTEEPKKENLRPPAGKAKSSSPRPKPALTIDTKCAEEASTSVTILMPKGTETDGETGKVAEGDKKKTRDRHRTLENMLKEVADKQSHEDKGPRPPPLLLVTQASLPSTPRLPSPATKEEWGSGSGSYYGSDEDVDDEEEGWTEGEDERNYDSDLEFCISETFRIPAKTRVDLYPPSMRGSPFVSDYESDCSAPFPAVQKLEDSRGRVNNLLFAVPPPTFTCSVSYDGQESWESDSVHSCEDGDEEDLEWRPGSSSLAAYRSPGPFESDEDLDGAHFCDSVQVGFTLKLVDKAARKGSDESDSEYYDDEEDEYTEEEYWDEDEEYEEEEYTDEAYEEEGDECMLSAEEKSPSPLLFTASIGEEQLDYDETEETEFETSFEMAPPLHSEAVQPVDYTADKYREITYTQDLEMDNAEETTAAIGKEEKTAAKAVTKRIKKDGTTETASKIVTPQMVAPIEESINLMEAKEVATDVAESLSPSVVGSETATSAVNVVPTYARPLTAKVQEEFTNRFSTVKPSTDFAKKAVIQPAKLEKVQMKEAAVVEEAPPKLASPKEAPAPTEKPIEENKPKVTNKETAKPVEDKSSVRKSTLNMKEEDAKRKVAADEQVARQKARRLGTVGALADMFKPKEEAIVYKRSSRLEPKADEPRARRKYEIVKPVLNDEFDQQMKEIRAQMRAGSSQLQSEIKNLSKGITSLTEEAKKRELDDKHRQVLDKASGVFNRAEEEKQKWRERKIGKPADGEKTGKTAEVKVEEEPKKEPKRTIRRIKKDKDTEGKAKDTEPVTTLPGSEPTGIVAPLTLGEVAPVVRKDRAPVPAETLKRPAAPKQDIVVDDNNVELLKAATKAAARKRDIPTDMEKKDAARMADASTELATKIQRAQTKVAPEVKGTSTAVLEVKPHKSEGATATKIRNTLSAASNSLANNAQPNQNPLKRYATRRKTQEIVNESSQPKRRRRLVPRRGKFIGPTHDIDLLLGWSTEQTFEAMEIYFSQTAAQRLVDSSNLKQKRAKPTRTWISDLQDIDKIYKVSEMRDLKLSVEAN